MEMNAITVTHSPHPILPAAGRSFHAHGWRAGESVRNVLMAHGFDAHQEIVIGLNDRLLTVAEWDTLCPAPGDIINVQATVSGGDDSNPIAFVASIAMLFIAPQLSAAMWAEAGAISLGAGVTVGSLTSAVISVAGNALVNAVFKPSGGDLNRATTSLSSSPTYSLAGGSNGARPYEPLPIVMGRHIIFPDLGAKPFTELSGKNQYLYQLLNFGVSDLALSDFRIGNTPIDNFSDVTFHWPDAAGAMAEFPGNVDTISGGELTIAGGWVQRTTSTDTVNIAIDVEGIAFYADPEDGPLPARVTVEVEYRAVGSGTWLPMGRFGVKVYIQHYWSLGSYQTYQNGDYAETAWVQLTYGSTTYGDHGEGDPDTFTPPGAYEAQSGTWRWRPYSEILTSGDGSALSAPAPKQTWTVSDYSDKTIAHGTSADVKRSTFELAVAAGEYEVQVRMTAATADGIAIASPYGRAQYSFTQLRSYQADPASYVGQARVGLVIKASGQLNGVLQQLSAVASARCNAWDGANWVWGPTSNPAWWYLDFARGRYDADDRLLYGVGLAEAQVDVAGIKLWADFCDAQGLTFNAVIDRRQSCAEVLTMIARCGLASTSWASGKLGVIWDAVDATPVMAFGMSNIARGSFSVEYLSENLADEIVVSYVDADRDWQVQQVRASVPNVTSPDRTTTIDLMGCTNATLAGKFANVVAAQQYYRRRTVSWETDFEGFICQRGDVVLLSHDLTQWGYSGRIVSVDGDDVTLDRAVPRTAVDYLTIREPDGTLTTYTVAAGTGDSNVLTLTSTPALQASTLPMDHVWIYSPLPTPGKKVKIISITPASESRVRIVATDEDPEFYAAWDGTWTQVSSNTLLADETPAITRIDLVETLALLATGTVGSRITASLTVSRATDLITAQWRIDGSEWTDATVTAGTVTIETTQTGLFEIEARPFYGQRIGALFSASLSVAGKTLPPDDVSGFSIVAIGGQAHLSWAPSANLDVTIGGYLRMRHTPDIVSPTWSNAVDIGPQIPGIATNTVLPLIAGSYLAKWVDSSGIESDNTTAVITNAPSISVLNNLATISEHPDFTGTKVNLAAVDDVLKLDSLETIDDQLANIDTWAEVDGLGGLQSAGTYTVAGYIDLGSVQSARLTAAISSYSTLVSDYIDSRGEIDSWSDVDGLLPSAGSFTLYARTTDDDPAGAPTWGDWQAFSVGDQRARAFQFKVELSTSVADTNVIVSALTVTVDLPDRIEAGDDIASGAGTYAVTYTLPFNVPPAVGISAQNMATGDYYSISNKDEAGFDIVFRNSGGSAVSRTFDYIAKGY